MLTILVAVLAVCVAGLSTTVIVLIRTKKRLQSQLTSDKLTGMHNASDSKSAATNVDTRKNVAYEPINTEAVDTRKNVAYETAGDTN